MKRALFLLLCPMLLFSETLHFLGENQGEFIDDTLNSVGRWIYTVTTVTNTGVTLEVYEPPRMDTINGLVTEKSLADISTKPSTTTLTWPAFKKAGSLSTNIQISATPNPLAPVGYQVQLQLLTPYLITGPTGIYSPQFFDFQAVPISFDFGAALVFEKIFFEGADIKRWFTTAYQGLVLSNSWSTNQILQSLTKKKSTTTYTLSIPYATAVGLPTGTYWIAFYALMSPYSVGSVSDQITAISNRVDPAVGGYLSLHNLIQGDLLHRAGLTTGEVVQLHKSDAIVISDATELIYTGVAQYTALLPEANVAETLQIQANIAQLQATLALF